MADGRKAPALIAGGGIGGLAAALALARIGWRSVIAERRDSWSEAGAGIQLSPNGVRVLAQLGVAQRLEPQVGTPREIIVRDAATAHVLQRLPLGDWIAHRHGAPYWQVHRRDLQAALLAAISEEPLTSVLHGFDVTALASDEDSVHLEARDGRHIAGSMLIGADGIFSVVRHQLFSSKMPRFPGRTAARTVVRAPVGTPESAILSEASTGVWLAPGAHIVHYPVRGGREIAVVVVRAETWSAPGWSEPVPSDEIERALQHVAPQFAMALGKSHSWRRWALFEAEPLAHWSKGRVTLIGDAAHPTMPFLAQGGSLALEDAATLAACLSPVQHASGIPAALAAYETARLDRCRRVVSAARRNGVIFHLSGPAAFARNLAMRALSGERVMAGYDWVYGWRPPTAAGIDT
jgi:salicylate hydroxylase